MKVLRKQEHETSSIQVGDQILIPLEGFGNFTATAHQVADNGVLFVFDEYVTKRPMNKKNTNNGGFEKSDLKKWMDTVLIGAFPDEIRGQVTNLSIPTVGQMFGHDDEWNNTHFEPDTDEQLLLITDRRNRIAFINNDWEWGWLRNAMKQELSAALFANVVSGGGPYCYGASDSYGVRPVFWLV